MKKMRGFIVGFILGALLFGGVWAYAAGISAQPKTAEIIIDGIAVDLKGFVIEGHHYFQLRDLADSLRPGGKDFSIVWDGAHNRVLIDTSKRYDANETAPPPVLNTTSVDAFIRDIKTTYAIMLTDKNGYLSGPDGQRMMEELGRCLALYSPGFIQKLVACYSRYDANFIVQLEGPVNGKLGHTDWADDLVISLYYNSHPSYSGISAAYLSHELGHTVHFLVEKETGGMSNESEITVFNRNFSYVGDRYNRVWSEGTHGTTFAYDYGMCNHYEDVATILERLVADPEGMCSRLNDPQNTPLRKKTEYIRDMAYQYISDECAAVFAPLNENTANTQRLP